MTLTGNTFFFPWEATLMEWLQAHIGPLGIEIISRLSMFGEELVLIVLLGFLYWCYDKRFGCYVGLNMLVANTWNPMIKNVFLRRRPYFDHAGVDILRVVEPEADIYDIAAQGYSFPSGHSTGSAAVYGSLPRYKKGKKALFVIALIVPLLVGFSRVVVGAHYPTDVLVGWLVGVAALFIVPWLEAKMPSRPVFYAVLLLTTLPGLFYCKSADYFTSLGMLLGFFVAVPFEERFVNFETTRNPIRCVLRILGGIAVFFVLNTAFKLPFSEAFLDGGSYPALLVRALRYGAIVFVDFALYPMLFRYTARIGKKAEA